MIRIENFTFAYPGTGKPALEDVSFEAAKGELLLVRGASGSGKSTLLYAINGLVPHIFNGESSGTIQVNGFSPGERPIGEISKTVGTVLQNVESQIFMMRVEDDVAFGCENLRMPREEILLRREEALKAMDLWEMRERETFKLSGGQKQRLTISAIYAMGPKIFLFDEPTTDLDQGGRKEFFNILKRLKSEGKVVLLAEHQYEEYLPLVDRVVTLDRGRTVPSVQALRDCPEPVYGVGNLGDIVISCKGLCVGYEKGEPVLKHVDLEVRKGEFVALCGKNGSGKTTLLKSLAGILRPSAGCLNVLEKANPDLESLMGHVGFLFQNPDEQLFADCVEEEVAFGPRHLGKEVDIEKYLRISGLYEARGSHPQALSRGQRQLLAVTSILAMEPDILLLDEPTTGLDDTHWRRLLSLLHQSVAEGKTVVFTTHNGKAAGRASRSVHLEEGRIVSDEIRQ
ncbi:MAG: ABC transporter ATP-binding protein [Deltaproteobacteria bacterium]|nr:ABC transporter ATP-binding protein [Deltaproteobacteria bacterium]